MNKVDTMLNEYRNQEAPLHKEMNITDAMIPSVVERSKFNWMKMGGGIAIFLLISIFFYYTNQKSIGKIENTFNASYIKKVNTLASKLSLMILEKDILSIQSTIKDAVNDEQIIFMAILDHDDIVIGHTDSNLLNEKFQGFKIYKPLNHEDKKVALFQYESPETGHARIFASDIVFSNIKIGKIIYAVSENDLRRSIGKIKALMIAEVSIVFVFVIFFYFLIGKINFKPSAMSLDESEDITQVVGSPYIMKKKIAQGGMSELFLADYVREGNFRKTVAVKRILPHLAEDQTFIQMLAREARLAALLQHPNIVQIIDFGKIQNVYFLAMELIRGKDLSRIMNAYQKGFSVEQTLFIFSEVCAGLQHSHEKTDDTTGKPLGIVHRDINPQNILISYRGEVKITDFGISKAGAEASFTRAGDIKGKISYLSPEQALGKEVDLQADLYALGVTIYEVLSGRRLYKFETDLEAIREIPNMEIPPINTIRTDIPERLNNIVMKCLEKDKEKRYQSARDIHDDLLEIRRSMTSLYDARDLAKFMNKLFPDE